MPLADHQVTLLLTLEELTLAMQCLYHNQQPPEDLLWSMRGEDWKAVSDLLVALLRERQESTVH